MTRRLGHLLRPPLEWYAVCTTRAQQEWWMA
jgi:hypothetical protein